MIDRPRRHTRERYQQSAQWRQEWPRRFLVVGQRLMPVWVHLQSVAAIHSRLSRRVSTLHGEVLNLKAKVRGLEYRAQKTQEYIRQGQARLEQAAADGLTCAQFLEQDRIRAKTHWHPDEKPGIASEPRENENVVPA